MQTSLESQLQAAKDSREKLALEIFDSKGKLKAGASPIKLKLYYKYDNRMRTVQLELNKGEIEARKVQITSQLKALGFAVGDTVKHSPTGVIGTITLDTYGYALITPTDEAVAPYNRTVALYNHSMRDLRKV